jgi:hypothetical protein
MSFELVNKAGPTGRAGEVLGWSKGLEMFRVAASRFLALVVQLQSGGNRAQFAETASFQRPLNSATNKAFAVADAQP